MNVRSRFFQWAGFVFGGLGIMVSVVSIVLAMRATAEAARSNQIAEDANRIAVEANRLVQEQRLPRILATARSSMFLPYNNGSQQFICITPEGDYRWQVQSAYAVDVTNVGGAATSLTSMWGTLDSKMVAGVDWPASLLVDQVVNKDQLRDWNEMVSTDDILKGIWDRSVDESMNSFTLSGPPIGIGPGETKRLLVRIQLDADIPQVFTTAQAIRDSYNQSSYWDSTLHFRFADETTYPLPLRLSNPFSWMSFVRVNFQTVPFCSR